MRGLFFIGGIVLLFAACKKTKTYSTLPSITIYNSNTKSSEPNVKVVLKDVNANGNNIVLQTGYTDNSGTFTFSEFPATEGHSYEIRVYIGCGEGQCHIRNGSHANYSYTITPANNVVIDCPGMMTGFVSDSMRVEFKHKYFSAIGYQQDASAWFYVSSLNPLTNGQSIVAFTGEYYVTIYRVKAGVLTTSYDSVIVPTPTSCVPSCSYTYSY